MNRRKAFTLIELLIVLAILAILVTIGLGVISKFTGAGSKVVHGEVIDKWTDFDYENNKIYRIRTRSPSGEVDTWNSYWVHDTVAVGQTYDIKIGLTGDPNEAVLSQTGATNGGLPERSQ